MIIQCDQCQTKFRLDDSKVTDKSIKVRCAKCRSVFSVPQAQPVAEESVSLWQDEALFPSEAEQESMPAIQEMEPDAETEATLMEEVTPEPAGDLDFGDFNMPEEPSSGISADADNEDEGFSFPSLVSEEASEQAQTEEATDEMDFGAFDFGDDSGDEPPAVTRADVAASPAKEDFGGGLDFSGDDMFGEVVSTPAAEETSDSISFDMGMDGFADSMGVEGSPADLRAALASQDTSAENPFSMDDIDFGDELTSVAVQQVSTEELKPSHEFLFAPLAATEAQPATFTLDEPPTTTPSTQVEQPPLSIASRRKAAPRFSSMLLLLWAMVAGLVIFYSYWGITTLTGSKGELVVQETGKITLRSVDAVYVKNKALGTLLVISGEAVNEYNKPRASIQVKGIIFGADGEEVASKSAFCGNPLSSEQLATMPMDKIEAAMSNQFGDSLANMELAPGDAIPFVIVIAKPDKVGTDYGVEPAGSTVAADKAK